MEISYLCVLIAALIPYVLTGYAKLAGKGYDNRSPREFQEKLSGPAKRAHFAQLNSFEAFPAFAAAVIIAHLAGVDPSRMTALSIGFVVCRVLYGIFYIIDQPTLRTLVWAAGFFCVIGLFIQSL